MQVRGVPRPVHLRKVHLRALMRGVPASEAAATFDCKIPNCDGEARANRGKHAYLCDHHKTSPPAAVRAEHAPPDIVEAARKILPAAAALKKKLQARHKAGAEARAALAAFNESLNDLKASAQALLNGDQA